MPHQLELFPTDDDDDFDSPYLDLRLAINTLEQLDFRASRQVLELRTSGGKTSIIIEIGWPWEPALEHDRDVFAQLVEETGTPITRIHDIASVNLCSTKISLIGAFPNPDQVGDRPTINDLYPSTKFGERGERGRLNPLMETALGQFRPKDQ